MPARWVICRMATDSMDGRVVGRAPKVGLIADPGRPAIAQTDPDLPPLVLPTYGYDHTVVGVRNDLCLTFASGVDLAGIAIDPDVVDLFEMDFADGASMRAAVLLSPSALGWSSPRVTRVRDRLTAAGADATDLSRTGPSLRDWLARVATVINPRHALLRLI